MDLNQLNTAQIANQGAIMTVRHPDTNEPLAMTITLLGADSKAFRFARNLAINRRLKSNARLLPTAEETDATSVEMLADCTVAWTGIELEGKPLDCTRENAVLLYSNPGLGWLREQVDRFVGDRANFLKPPSAT